jgi:hypothetical protein
VKDALATLVDAGRPGEQDHSDDPISRKYCRTVPWTFVKQVGQ